MTYYTVHEHFPQDNVQVDRIRMYADRDREINLLNQFCRLLGWIQREEDQDMSGYAARLLEDRLNEWEQWAEDFFGKGPTSD